MMKYVEKIVGGDVGTIIVLILFAVMSIIVVYKIYKTHNYRLKGGEKI